jgi:hypothetical protein
MKYFLIGCMLCSIYVTHAQTPNWNPDYNQDNLIGADDLLGVLSIYGMDWENVVIQYHETSFTYDSVAFITNDTILVDHDTDVLVITAGDTSNWVFAQGFSNSYFLNSENFVTIQMAEEVNQASLLVLFEVPYTKALPNYRNGWTGNAINDRVPFTLTPFGSQNSIHTILLSLAYDPNNPLELQLPIRRSKNLVYFNGSFWPN